MKKALVILVTALALTSCGTTSTALYEWGTTSQSSASAYEHLTYTNYHKQTPESVCELVVLYENLVKRPGGTRQRPAPGICAEYGYLLLSPETAATFAQYATKSQKGVFVSGDYTAFFREYGLQLMQQEMEYYPESVKFIQPLLERFSK